MRITARLEGAEELQDALRAAGRRVRGVGRRAAGSGGEEIRRAANARAPGPHIVMVTQKKRETWAEALIGPDVQHWYYRFFETGVMPWEMDKATGRTRRSSGGGRKIRGDRKAFAFEGQGSVVTKGPLRFPGMPARPFLRPAFDAVHQAAVRAVGRALRQAVEDVGE